MIIGILRYKSNLDAVIGLDAFCDELSTISLIKNSKVLRIFLCYFSAVFTVT